MSVFSLRKMKNKPLILRNQVLQLENEFHQSTVEDLSKTLDKLNSAYSKQKYKTIRLHISAKLICDETIEKLINLMPIFSHSINNKISTLLQSTIRETPKRSFASYLVAHSSVLRQLFQYSQNPDLCSISTILLREAIKVEYFNEFFLDYFIWYFPFSNLFSNQFEVCASSFSLLKTFLVQNPNISSKLAEEQYANTIHTLLIQLRELLSCNKFLVVNLTIDLISSIFSRKELHSLSEIILKDLEIMQNIIKLLGRKSKKTALSSYNLFKHFIIYEEKTEQERKTIVNNKNKLIKCLIKIDQYTDDPDILDERDLIINYLRQINQN